MTSLSTSQSLVGTAGYSNAAVGSCTGNSEPNLGLVKGAYKSQESEGVALGDIYHGVPVREISVASNSPNSRDTWELEEPEEESCDWALNMEAG